MDHAWVSLRAKAMTAQSHFFFYATKWLDRSERGGGHRTQIQPLALAWGLDACSHCLGVWQSDCQRMPYIKGQTSLVFRDFDRHHCPPHPLPNNRTTDNQEHLFDCLSFVSKQRTSLSHLPTTNATLTDDTCQICLDFALGTAATANRALTTSIFTLRASTVVACAATTAPLYQHRQTTETKPSLCTAAPTSYLPLRLHHHTTAMGPRYLP